MKKKVIIISILTVCILGLALILTWWNGYTPLMSRAAIERRLNRALTTDYEFVSSELIKGSRSEIHYTYKDANGIEFTVESYKERETVYASTLKLWWSNRIVCNYTQMFMAQYDSYIKELFGDRLDSDASGSNKINIYNYKQLAETADMLAKLYAEIPPYRINREVYGGLFRIDPNRFIVEFRYGNDYTYAATLGYFDLLCEGEKAPAQSEILISLEDSMASLYKSGRIDVEIPYDVLMRNPPTSFKSVMIGDTDINPKLAWGVKWKDDRYLFSTYIFGGEHGSFAYMVKKLGGSYELINSGHAKWNISGNIWEAHLKSSKRVHAGYAEYEVDNINITKNGEVLSSLESSQSAMYTLRDIEMLLGVRTEYTNDVAILYLIPDNT